MELTYAKPKLLTRKAIIEGMPSFTVAYADHCLVETPLFTAKVPKTFMLIERDLYSPEEDIAMLKRQAGDDGKPVPFRIAVLISAKYFSGTPIKGRAMEQFEAMRVSHIAKSQGISILAAIAKLRSLRRPENRITIIHLRGH